MDGLAAKDLAAALLHTREAIRLAQSQKQARIGARWRAGVRPREGGGGGLGGTAYTQALHRSIPSQALVRSASGCAGSLSHV